MPNYKVNWEIDVETDGGPFAAAKNALSTMQEVGSTATYFTVVDQDTKNEFGVDLFEEFVEQPVPSWTVILLYPECMTDDFGADIYVDSAKAEDPRRAVEIVQEMCAAANSDDIQERNPDDFRCIGVIRGEHNFVLDATSFQEAM